MFNNIQRHIFFVNAFFPSTSQEYMSEMWMCFFVVCKKFLHDEFWIELYMLQEIFACWILNWVVHVAGEGVGVALSSFKKGTEVYEVEYCAYVELRRPVFKKDQSLTAGEFQVLTNTGQTGVSYSI